MRCTEMKYPEVVVRGARGEVARESWERNGSAVRERRRRAGNKTGTTIKVRMWYVYREREVTCKQM